MKYCKLLLLLLLMANAAGAQNVVMQGRLLDARTNMPLAQATVDLLSLQDTFTYQATTGLDGTFRIIWIHSLGKYALLVQKKGYANYVKAVEAKMATNDLGNLIMVDSSRLLREALVKAKRNAYIVKGDTIEYSASYYKTNPDMDAVYLLNKMPGIDLANMRAHGDTISKVQINGIVVFGDNPKKILSLIPAGIIEKVMVYSDTGEVNNTGVKGINAAKVINIKTADNALARPNGKAYAGYGTGEAYLIGLNAIQQKADGQISVNVSANRADARNSSSFAPGEQYQSIGIPTAGRIALSYTRSLSKRDQLSVNYYLDNTSTDISRNTLNQYSLDSGTASISETISRATPHNLSNSVFMYLTRKNGNKNEVKFNTYASQSSSRSEEHTLVRSTIEGIRAESSSLNKPSHNDLNLNSTLSFANNAHAAANYKASLNYVLYTNKQFAEVLGYNSNPDTLIQVNFKNALSSLNHTLGLTLSGENKIASQQALSYSISSRYRSSRAMQSRKLYSDTANEYTIPDSLFSVNVDYQTLDNRAEIKDVLNYKKGNLVVELNGELQYYLVQQADGVFSKGYTSFNPSINVRRKYSTIKELSFAVSKRSEMPGYEHINPIINASSNYLFTVGNINITPAPRYQVSGRYKSKFLLDESLLNVFTSAIYIHNNITNSVYLPTASNFYYDGRLIPIGAQLSYAENVGNYKYLYESVSIEAPLKPLKTILKFNTNYQLRSTDAMVNNELANTLSHDYISTATFTSVISTRLDFVLYLACNVNNSKQTRANVVTDRWLQRLLLNTMVVGQLDSRQTVRLEANLNSTSGLVNNEATRFYLMDISYQLKLLRDKKLSCGITIHDLLDSYRSYGYDYRNNSINSYTSNSVGRYLLFIMNYTF